MNAFEFASGNPVLATVLFLIICGTIVALVRGGRRMSTAPRTILFGALLWAFGFGAGFMFWSRVDTAPPTAVIINDPVTGCDYVLSPGNGLTPRIDAEGFPICHEVPVETETCLVKDVGQSEACRVLLDERGTP